MPKKSLTQEEEAKICLFCTKPECIGATACFNERKKLYLRNKARERRRAEVADRWLRTEDQRRTKAGQKEDLPKRKP